MSSKIDLNDIDIDYWTFDLGGYTDNLYKEIIIFDISREDLLNSNGTDTNTCLLKGKIQIEL